MVRELRKVCSGDLGSAAHDRGVDLFATLATYNFDFWFDGSRGVVILDLDEPCVATVSIEGAYEIYCCAGGSCSELESELEEALGLREDVSDFLERASRDPLLKLFARRFSGWRLRTSSLWWSLVIGVCQQNASFRQGWSMLRRIVLAYGERVRAEKHEVPLPPTPRRVADDPGPLRSARVGYRARVITDVARAFVRGEISEDSVASASPREAEAMLRSVRGVGPYTARLALALSKRIYDLPPIDRWVKAIASAAYGVNQRYVEEEWVKRWGRWSALAVIALTVALDAQPLRKAMERVEKGELLPKKDLVPSPLNLWKWRE